MNMNFKKAIEQLKKEFEYCQSINLKEKLLLNKVNVINALIEHEEAQQWEILSNQLEFSKNLEIHQVKIDKLEMYLAACGINIKQITLIPLTPIQHLEQYVNRSEKCGLFNTLRVDDIQQKYFELYVDPANKKIIDLCLIEKRKPTLKEIEKLQII